MAVNKSVSRTSLRDPDSGVTAGVELINGKNRLLTSSVVTIEQLFGRDLIPDSYFTITEAGAIGDTIRLQVAAVNDPTASERDLPAVDYTYTLVAGDVGDEKTLAQNFADGVNSDTDFQNAFLEAEAVTGTQRAVVHITSTEFSGIGEYHERPNVGDFLTTTTGTTSVVDAFDNLVSRGKGTSLARDPDNPHIGGILGISGSVRVSAEDVQELLEEFASNGGNTNLAVNPGGTPDEYVINANPAGGKVKVIEVFKFYGSDGNIKVGGSNFLGLNSPLTNGLEIQLTKNNATTVFRNVKTTSDFLARLSSSPEKSILIPSSGVDFIESVFDLVARNVQLKLEPGTTDEVKIIVQDNLSSVDELYFVTEGFLEED